MKEEDAKKKICPMLNRGASGALLFCRANDCAVWESWERKLKGIANDNHLYEGYKIDPEEPTKCFKIVNKNEGECGLITKYSEQ